MQLHSETRTLAVTN